MLLTGGVRDTKALKSMLQRVKCLSKGILIFRCSPLENTDAAPLAPNTFQCPKGIGMDFACSLHYLKPLSGCEEKNPFPCLSRILDKSRRTKIWQPFYPQWDHRIERVRCVLWVCFTTFHFNRAEAVPERLLGCKWQRGLKRCSSAGPAPASFYTFL